MNIRLNFDSGENPILKRNRINDKRRPPSSTEEAKPFPSGSPISKRETQIRPAKSFQIDKDYLAKVNQLLREFDQLVGLEHIKNLIKEIVAYIEIQKHRSKAGLAVEAMSLHMLFKGSPGTGKTTVARLIGEIYKELGVLSKGHLVEVDRADLVGEYIGHTAQKTKEQLKRAMGGILFIDEAYSLARGGEKDFGIEATDVLVKIMEDQRQDLIVILAGYTKEMEEFVDSNPGLKSRFPIQLDFPNYSVLELLDIAKIMINKREYVFTDKAWVELEGIIRKAILQGQIAAGNGRFVRNLLEKAIRRQALRLVTKPWLTKGDLITLTREDLYDKCTDEPYVPKNMETTRYIAYKE